MQMKNLSILTLALSTACAPQFNHPTDQEIMQRQQTICVNQRIQVMRDCDRTFLHVVGSTYEVTASDLVQLQDGVNDFSTPQKWCKIGILRGERVDGCHFQEGETTPSYQEILDAAEALRSE
jgi:hypothetical protein